MTINTKGNNKFNSSQVRSYKTMEELEAAEAGQRVDNKQEGQTMNKKTTRKEATPASTTMSKSVENVLAAMDAAIKDGKKVTLSDRMRALQSEGLTVSEIAKLVGKPYRQVYSTLNHDKYIGGVIERRKAKEVKKDEERAELERKVAELEAKLARRQARK